MFEFADILAMQTATTTTIEELKFARWSSGNALLIGCLISAVLLYAVAWMYKREARGQASGAVRWALAGCRTGVLMLLGLMGLEPVRVSYVERRLDAHTLVLIDSSASMSLADAYRDAADAQRVEKTVGSIPSEGLVRADICQAALQRDQGAWIRSLARNNAVKVFSFAHRAEPLASIGRRIADPSGEDDADSTRAQGTVPDEWSIQPNGAATDLGLALRTAIDSVAGAPIAAAIVLTDGCINHGESNSIIGQFLEQKRIDLFAVGIGDSARPVNVRVARIDAPRAVFKEDPFTISVHVEANGVESGQLRIDLLERRGTEPFQVVQTRALQVSDERAIPPLTFERKIKEPGSVTYAARVLPLPYEAVVSDNRRDIVPAIEVLDDKMKVLLIAGSPNYDYRFLTRMLERDKTVELSTWLQSADVNAVRDGDAVIRELPNTLEALTDYDAILLMDPDPRELEPTWGSLVAAYVADHAGGVLLAAGNKYTGRFFRSPNSNAIVEILPIVPDPEAEVIINELGHYQTDAWPIVIPDGAVGHPILQQSDDASETRGIWAVLGEVYWHYPVRREKPVAQALMLHANPKMAGSFGPHVLLATQFVGGGRTAYLGLNSTWRWRRFDERHFNRFWMQMLRYLVESRLLGGKSRGEILTQNDEFDLGETIMLTVRALDERFNPLLLPQLELEVAGAEAEQPEQAGEGGRQSIWLAPIPGRDGYYQGRFLPEAAGTIRLRAILPDGATSKSEKPASLEKIVVVSQPDLEMKETAMNRPGLKALVESAGRNSRFLEIDELAGLPPLIADNSQTSRHVGRVTPLWDNAYLFLLILLILTAEWILRKKAKLL